MSSKKRARGRNTVNTKKKLKDLPENKRNKIWSDEEMNIYAHVLANTDTAERSWLYQLENYALKKHANEELFRNIREEFEEALPEDSVEYRFTIDKLRAKYKWFKKEWRRIDTKIKAGTGLGGKDTTTPSWYDVLNPSFCEAVDDMTSISSKASDLDIYHSSSSEDQPKSDGDDNESISDNSLDINSLKTSHNTSGDMSESSTKSSIVEGSARASSNVDDTEESENMKTSKDVTGVKKKLIKRSPKKTSIKFHPSRRSSKPKSQSEAMLEVAKSIENSSVQQEKNKDVRLQALLEADRKRDEMFLAYQREQAEANRKHELLMAQLLLQPRPHTINMQHANYRNSYSHDLPLSSAGNTWNTVQDAGQDAQGENYTYHQL